MNLESTMALKADKDDDATTEDSWVSVSPGGLWEVRRWWTGERHKGDDTPLMGSVCKIRVWPKDHTEKAKLLLEAESVVDADSELQVTQHPRSHDSVLQVPLDKCVLMCIGEGQCDIIEGCLEGMRAGEVCELTVRPYQENSEHLPSRDHGTQPERTQVSVQPHSFFLYLHSFTPGQESWCMSPAEKWSWVQSHKQRGSQRFGMGDIWGAAHSYCCAVKLVITLRGYTRSNNDGLKEVDTELDDKAEEDGQQEENVTCSSSIPTDEEYRTMKAELHSNLSLCQLKLGQPMKARQSSSKATTLNPANVKAWYRLGQACLQLTEFREARQAFGKVLELQPDSASARNALKQVNAKAKEADNKLGQRLSKMFS